MAIAQPQSNTGQPISQADFGKQLRTINPSLSDDQITKGYQAFYPSTGSTTGTPTTTGGTSGTTQPTFDSAGYTVNPQDATQKGIMDFNASEANAPFDQNKIKSDTIGSFQSEIDALKGVYAQKLSEARQAGQNKLGQARAEAARTGSLGSSVGDATTDSVVNQNKANEGAIGDELTTKIGAITTQANKDANDAIASARAAKIAGGTAYLNSITSRDATKTSLLSKLGTSLLGSNIDPSTMSADQLKQLTDKYTAAGYPTTKEDIVSAFTDAKAAAAKAQKDNSTVVSEGQEIIGPDGKVIAEGKDKPITLSEGEAYYDPKTGQVIYKNPKTSAAGGIDGAGSTSLGVTTSTGKAIPDALAPYYKTSYNGLGYADLSSLTKSDQAKVAQLAVANGLTPIYDAATSGKLNAVSDANANLKEIQDAVDKITLGTKGIDVAGQGLENTLSKFFGNKDLKSFNAFRTAIINNVQALAGGTGSGLRINEAEINAAMENDLPVVSGIHADTPDSAKAKLQRLTKQLDTWEQQLVGGGVHANQDVTVGQNAATPIAVQTPDGQSFTFKDQASADAFKKEAGIQ